MRNRNIVFGVLVAMLCHGGSVRADALADWQQIEAMEKQGPGQQWQTSDEARTGTLDYLAKQEQTLRMFIATYPGDAHEPDAKMRLAHLLATRADLEENPAERRAADAMLDELEAEPGMKGRRADVEFARVSIYMQRVDALTGTNRGTLLEKARTFAREFPDDHRVASLLAEVASAFEDEPATAHTLLEEALPKAGTTELKQRITDDLKRLGLVGKTLPMQWDALDGSQVNLQSLRGKVVLIYFFASWSGPSMAGLDWVRQLAAQYPAESVQALGICLDKDPVAVPAMLSDHQITWPVYCDGHGWEGGLVRSLGINELPELWIVDANGVLLTLDAKDDAPGLIQKAMRTAGQ
jgi:thiol-disulfide isomerase/thioredoxin